MKIDIERLEEKLLEEEISGIDLSLKLLDKKVGRFKVKEGYFYGYARIFGNEALASKLKFFNTSLTIITLSILYGLVYAINSLNKKLLLFTEISLVVLMLNSLIAVFDIYGLTIYKKYGKKWLVLELLDFIFWGSILFSILYFESGINYNYQIFIFSLSSLLTFIRGVIPIFFLKCILNLKKFKLVYNQYLSFLHPFFSYYYILRFFLITKFVENPFSSYVPNFLVNLIILMPYYTGVFVAGSCLLIAFLLSNSADRRDWRFPLVILGILGVMFGLILAIFYMFKIEDFSNQKISQHGRKLQLNVVSFVI